MQWAGCIIQSKGFILLILLFMKLHNCFRIAVVTSLSVSALGLGAQTMRDADTETGSTITSLTSLGSPHHPAPPFGSIDVSFRDAVSLDVSVIPDLPSMEMSGGLEGTSALGRSAAKNAQFVGGSPLTAVPAGAAARAPSSLAVASGSSSQMRAGAIPQGSSSVLHGAASATSWQASAATGNLSLTAANPTTSKPPVSRSSGHAVGNDLPLGALAPDSRRISGSAPGTFSSSDQGDSVSSPYYVPDSSDSAQETGDGSNSASGLSGTATAAVADRQARSGFLERVQDPFGNPFSNRFEGNGKYMSIEKPCGDACSLNKTSLRSEGSDSEMSGTDSTAESSDRSVFGDLGRLPHTRLELMLGRTSGDVSGSESQVPGRRSDMKRTMPGSSNRIDQKGFSR